MNPKKLGMLTTAMALVFWLAGCSGGGGSTSTPPPATYTVGGTISGLAASGLVLANGSQTVSPASGTTSFTFPTSVTSGTSYSVTVQTQPSGETCSVSGGSGTVGSSNVTGVAVSCAANTYTIGGTITGLTASGLALTNGGQILNLASGATSFTFTTAVASGTTYSVTVMTQPSGENCSVSNGSGTVGSSNVTSVSVSCAADTYTIGGTISGLTASGLVLADGSQTVSPVSGAGSFTFPTAVVSGTSYSVTVQTQPSGEVCSVAGGSGMVGPSNVYSVSVSCVATAFTIGGSISGLTASGLVLADGSQTVFPAAGATLFTFPTAVASGTTYSVTVQTQPSGEACSIGRNSGTVGSSNVTNVVVLCSPSYTIGGTITGLTASGLVLSDGGETISPVSGATSFTFPTPVASGNGYSVRVHAQPSGEFCLVANGTFILGSSNVTNVTVTCTASPESVLYSFQGGTSDGSNPYAGLIMDGSGNLYGTTEYGGTGSCQKSVTTTVSCGTVFKLTKGSGGSYTESVLYSFQGGASDGAFPVAGLIMDGSGNLYGTTEYGGPVGGNGGGTVFKLTPSGNGNYTESVLYSFQGMMVGSGDGADPEAGLIMDGSGNLYGTTQGGGTGSCQFIANNGLVESSTCGTVFKLTKGSGGSYTESVLYSFKGEIYSDGAYPIGSLIMDGSGNLYGTTSEGGAGNCVVPYNVGYTQQYLDIGCGTVFMLTSNGGSYGESVLYSFQGGASDGYYPYAGLIMDSGGNLYGTTSNNGDLNHLGTVFELTKGGNGTYTESVLHAFPGQAGDGWTPEGLIMDGSGNLYGTTGGGGTLGAGTIFKLAPGGTGSYTESVLFNFGEDGDGSVPEAGLIMDTSGNLYGTTASGGSGNCSGIQGNCGTVFELTQ